MLINSNLFFYIFHTHTFAIPQPLPLPHAATQTLTEGGIRGLANPATSIFTKALDGKLSRTERLCALSKRWGLRLIYTWNVTTHHNTNRFLEGHEDWLLWVNSLSGGNKENGEEHCLHSFTFTAEECEFDGKWVFGWRRNEIEIIW